ncbi:hypothetical protein Tco_1174792 [Tanacetum coccineum]
MRGLQRRLRTWEEGLSKGHPNSRERSTGRMRRLHPLGEYVITLYTNGKLRTRVTVTHVIIAFAVGKLKGYTNATRINNNKDNSSTRVFLLGGGEISWASKKHTCITISTMKYEFVALAAAGKEFEWLKNLVIQIP